ncbi:GIY-YIG nuclease family protein [Salinimicrobium sp. MT39]|uniref:GIY-YIG nuclease family protein n=1 Tax=Salinimicrobium profundisediminis TaxID=2994553 RepID=A0A9X3I0C8_9FLAO|nr:GIY-YIG nuclease family protein [Salinimicrobium profundisediminis]MCX2837875.1 GIY-YIG nuclease family protein [Salinimicrobium profundisediminis]
MSATATFDKVTIDESVQKLEAISPVRVKEFFEGKSKDQFLRLRKKAGVYAFWWVGDSTVLRKEINKQRYQLKGPANREDHIQIIICEDWIKAATCEDRICLYVGKTTNLNQRISGHLRYTVKDIWTDSKGNCRTKEPFSFEKKPNTVSQLRIGLERIFHDHSLDYIKKNIAISWLELEDNEEVNNSLNRFYIEDKMVADLFPIFNVDVER